jgi:precorrin-8X/cobalt-precorrin-8 methylmutase
MKGLLSYPYVVGGRLQLAELRLTELALRGVQSTWKLMGNGSVGSQALLGIPAVASLRDDPSLSAVSRVWPFETDFTDRPTPDRGPFVLHAEIWPGIVNHLLDPVFPVRDQAQVHAFVTWLAAGDRKGTLAHLFACSEGLTDSGRAVCVQEEGWILGAGPTPSDRSGA